MLGDLLGDCWEIRQPRYYTLRGNGAGEVTRAPCPIPKMVRLRPGIDPCRGISGSWVGGALVSVAGSTGTTSRIVQLTRGRARSAALHRLTAPLTWASGRHRAHPGE